MHVLHMIHWLMLHSLRFVLYIFKRIHTKPFSCQIWSYLMPQNNWYKYIISSVFPFLFDWDCISQHRHIWWAIWVICGWDGIFQCRHIWWANWARPTVAHHNWFLPSSEDSTVAAREVETPPPCLFLTNLAFMHCSFFSFRVSWFGVVALSFPNFLF